MWPNAKETADLVTITEEKLNGKLHFVWSVIYSQKFQRREENPVRNWIE